MAVVEYTFTHNNTQNNTMKTEYTEQNIHYNKNT